MESEAPPLAKYESTNYCKSHKSPRLIKFHFQLSVHFCHNEIDPQLLKDVAIFHGKMIGGICPMGAMLEMTIKKTPDRMQQG